MHRRAFLQALGVGVLSTQLSESLAIAARSRPGEIVASQLPPPAASDLYLADLCEELKKTWPHSRRMNLVFHGHSVPAGYFQTPIVDTFNAYPHLTHVCLKERFPHAVVNAIVTAIGGEHAIQGAERFQTEVLCHRPDVVFIDYALNDLSQDMTLVRAAWSQMVEEALAYGTKVILLTPTLNAQHDPNDPNTPLQRHATQIKQLAAEYEIGLVDSLARFDAELKNGTPAMDMLSNKWNHPNRFGHDMVSQEIMKWFPGETNESPT